MRSNNFKMRLLIIGIVCFLISLYLYGTIRHITYFPLNIKWGDQGAYIDYAKRMYETRYAYVGGRNLMPAYPFIQSLFYKPGMGDEEFFNRGITVNIILSVILLLLLFPILKYYLPWVPAINLLLITAFTIFIFRASYFQCELLFYFLVFCAFVLLFKLIRKADWRFGLLAGIILGVAHLTKASVLPGFLLFLLFATIKMIYTGYMKLIKKPCIFCPNQNREKIMAQLVCIVVVSMSFLLVIYPYIRTSKKIFGRYFYNVNSTFYIWYDSWGEAKEGTRAHGDRIGWPDMPPEELPSLKRYIHTHTPKQILTRITNGFRTMLRDFSNPKLSYGFFEYFLIYLSFVLIVVFINLRKVLGIATENLFLVFFAASFLISYMILYAFYSAISSGNRFILVLFLPFMYSFSTIIFMPESRELSIALGGLRVKLVNIFNVLISLMLLFDIPYVITERIVKTYGGS